MRKLIFITIFLACSYGINAQCIAKPEDPCVEIHQSVLDRAAHAIDELAAAQVALKALQNVQMASDAERAAYKNLATVTDTAISVLQKGIADRDTLVVLQQKVIDTLGQLVDRLTAQLNRPKSAFQKFAAIVKDVMLIAAGITFGKGL